MKRSKTFSSYPNDFIQQLLERGIPVGIEHDPDTGKYEVIYYEES